MQKLKRLVLKSTRSTPIRYILVGGTAYVIEVAVLWLLNRRLHFGPVASVAISFWVGFVVAFVLQKIIAFENHEKTPKRVAGQLAGYAILVAWNYGFTLLATHLFARHTSVIIVRTVVIAITTLWNYYMYKRLFRLPQTLNTNNG